MPPAAQAILREDNKDKFYYQVIDSKGQLIAGDYGVPCIKASHATSNPHFFNSKIDGSSARIAYMKYPVPGTSHDWVLIQVAETVLKRQDLTNEITIAVVTPQVVLILLAALAVWLGVSRGLCRFANCSRGYFQSEPVGFSPVDEALAPNEIRSLVAAINDLLGRLNKDIEAQRRFVANAAHQLRTPLAGLKTQSELASRQSDPEHVSHALKQIHSSAARVTRLVNQLLSLAKFEPTGLQMKQFDCVDLNSIARDATRELVPAALIKAIDLGFESSETPALIEGDDAGVYELIINLIDNAVRYTQNGGKVTVKISVKDKVSLLVEDNGPGIPEEERERVFERFYRVLGNNVSGSGLGLAIVQEIAEVHQAKVSISQEENGTGTVFEVKFPVYKSLVNIDSTSVQLTI